MPPDASMQRRWWEERRVGGGGGGAGGKDRCEGEGFAAGDDAAGVGGDDVVHNKTQQPNAVCSVNDIERRSWQPQMRPFPAAHSIAHADGLEVAALKNQQLLQLRHACSSTRSVHTRYVASSQEVISQINAGEMTQVREAAHQRRSLFTKSQATQV